VSDAGGLDLDTLLARLDAAITSRMATFTLPTNFAALGINASGDVLRVTLVDTTTANTDMRGTNNAALASVCTEVRLAQLGAFAMPTTLASISLVVDALNGRLTPDRAGYLDQLASENLPAAIVEILEDSGTTIPGLLSSLETHLTDIGGSTFDGTTDSLEAIRNRGDAAWSGSSSVTVSPIAGTIASRFVSADIDLVQYEAVGFGPLVITDTDGNPIDLSGVDLALVVYPLHGATTEVWRWTTNANELIVSGDNSNQVTISDDATRTQQAGSYAWVLWDTTNDYPKQYGGTLSVRRCASPGVPS
jgi:hypothetical protein